MDGARPRENLRLWLRVFDGYSGGRGLFDDL
jgi:hypothetical protein